MPYGCSSLVAGQAYQTNTYGIAASAYGCGTSWYYAPLEYAACGTTTSNVTFSGVVNGYICYNYPIQQSQITIQSGTIWMQQHAGWQHEGWQQGLSTGQLQQQWNQAQNNIISFQQGLQEHMGQGVQPQPIEPSIPQPVVIATDHEKARKRARRLLMRHLNPMQRDDLEKSNTFILRTDTRRYRIRPGDRVEELREDGSVSCRFCIHPSYDVGCPKDDWAIVQKLLIESDEEEFRRLANKSAA